MKNTGIGHYVQLTQKLWKYEYAAKLKACQNIYNTNEEANQAQMTR